MINTRFFKKSFLLSLAVVSALSAAPSKAELDDMTKIIGYFPEWGIYSGHNNYTPAKVELEKITHVNYAFATIKDGVIDYFDKYAAVEVTHDEAWDSPYKGNLGQLEKLKADHPHLSVLVSIGGWSQSGNFHDVASTQAKRDKFAQSVVQFVRTHKLDGADIDWEYPASVRQPDLVDNPNDQGTPDADASEKQTFTLLMQTLRVHLDAASQQDGKYYQLSAAVSAGFTNIENTEPALYSQYLDFVNIMTYDMHGAWDTTTNHQSALYANPTAPDDLNINSVINKFKSYGISSKKLIIGTPFYTRGWKNVGTDGVDADLPGLFASADGGADGILDGGVAGGVNPYYHALDMENDPAFTKYYDEDAEAPYLYSASKKELYTYEDKRSLQAKIDYVKEQALGGMIIWELSSDAAPSHQENLLNVIYTGFYPNGISVDGDDTNSSTGDDNNTSTGDGEDTPTATEWNATTVYTGGEVVSFNTQNYKAKWWTQGDIPGAEEYGPWELTSDTTTDPDDNDTSTGDDNNTSTGDDNNTSTGDDNNTSTGGDDGSTGGDNGTGTWSGTAIYTGGEVVVYNGVKYKAKWWTQNNIPGTEEYGPWEVVSDDTPVTDPVDTTNPDDTNTSTGDDGSTGGGTDPVDGSSGTVSLSTLQEKEESLTNTPAMQLVKASIATISNDIVEQITPLNPNNPSNVKCVEGVVSASDWEFLFPQRTPEYTYTNFLKAVGKFPAFCGDYDDGRDADKLCRTSLATMFAHFTQETGGHTAGLAVPEWRQGLVHVREMGWNEEMRGGYNSECNPDIWQGEKYPCGTFDDGEFKSYFGRGAKQLSYNYNYGPFSEAMTGDVSTLLNNPELVADTWYNLASAVFFYVYPQPPKPSMLHVVDGTWVPNQNDIDNGLTQGFGVTTNIINGGVECGGSTEIAQSLNRIEYYTEFANHLGVNVPSDEVLGCANMKQFTSDSSAALPIYWEEDWSWSADSADGKSYACQLVNYQTPYSAFKEGDYVACVEDIFNVTAE